jgi:hypothetical protein
MRSLETIFSGEAVKLLEAIEKSPEAAIAWGRTHGIICEGPDAVSRIIAVFLVRHSAEIAAIQEGVADESEEAPK